MKSKWFAIHKGKTLVGQCQLIATGTGFILGDFIVYKRFRNKGYGDSLLCEVLKYVKDKSIMLWVEEKNLPALQLYLKHGFKDVGMDTGRRRIMVRKNIRAPWCPTNGCARANGAAPLGQKTCRFCRTEYKTSENVCPHCKKCDFCGRVGKKHYKADSTALQ